MSYLSYAQINSLEEISFIGGTDYTLEFTVYDQNGSPMNLTGATCSWKMSPYGQPDGATLALTETPNANGSVVTRPSMSVMRVYINSADTLSIDGKFMHQPLVVYSGQSFRSQQGVINITPAIVT